MAHLHIKPSLYVYRRAQGSQIFKQNLDSFMFYRVFTIQASLAPGDRAGRWWISGVIRVSLYKFRVFIGKEFSNRIELSQLVQDLLTVSDLGSLQLWGRGQMGVGAFWAWGMPPDMYTHACSHAHT